MRESATTIPDITAAFAELVKACQATLIEQAKPVAIAFVDRKNLASNELPADLLGKQINLYALWTRMPPAEQWELMYIGQRQSHQGWARVKQHLFKVPRGTQSKLALVHDALSRGLEIGVSGVLIPGDALRLAVEEELIKSNVNGVRRAPWNVKAARRKARVGGQLVL